MSGGVRILQRSDFGRWDAGAAAAVPADAAEREAIRSWHRSLPDYAPTPLRHVPEASRRLGVCRVLVKDETERLGLPAFKMLGASWAVAVELSAWLRFDLLASPSFAALRAALAEVPAPPTLVAATDGNHGRAVARMARLLELPARIHVPAGTAQARVDAIASEGAEVVELAPTWDAAVRAALAEADATHIVVNDTVVEGSASAAAVSVVKGYVTIFGELAQQLEHEPAPTHVAVQIGCGALAAAVAEHTLDWMPHPSLIGVEPTSADCLLQSAAAGRSVVVPGPHHSLMAGLNCGEPSAIALAPVLERFAGFVAIDDAWACDAVRLLHDSGIRAGESGAAGLAGLLALQASEPGAGDALRLDANANVLLFVTEGPTDPTSYAAIVDAEAHA